MSDDLVKRLWLYDCEGITREAADRIEELEARLKTAEEIGRAFEEDAGQLREKLEAAVEQMQRVKDFRYDPNIGVELNMLEATLAKIKEEADG